MENGRYFMMRMRRCINHLVQACLNMKFEVGLVQLHEGSPAAAKWFDEPPVHLWYFPLLVNYPISLPLLINDDAITFIFIIFYYHHYYWFYWFFYLYIYLFFIIMTIVWCYILYVLFFYSLFYFVTIITHITDKPKCHVHK